METKWLVKLLKDENGNIIDKEICYKVDTNAMPRGGSFIIVTGEDVEKQFAKIVENGNKILIEKDQDAIDADEADKIIQAELKIEAEKIIKQYTALLSDIDNIKDLDSAKTVLTKIAKALRYIVKELIND